MPDLAASLRDTSRRLAALNIVRPTVLVDEARVRANIALLAERAQTRGVRLRPHVKTHQAPMIAAWMRDAGVTAITVSSLDMAAGFAAHGWEDITVAILVNPRQVTDIAALAARVRLGVLVDRADVVRALETPSGRPLRAWVKIDAGYGRTGIPWEDNAGITGVVRAIAARADLEYAGLLTHAGQSYHAQGADAAAQVFVTVRVRMQAARSAVVATGLPAGEISVGDTPGCVSTADWQGVDEVRAGNFVFFDLMQHRAGICAARRIACAVACPVLGVYPDDGRLVVHGGAVHLSKERLASDDGESYGEVMTLREEGLGEVGLGALWPRMRVVSLTQEHGVIRGDAETIAALKPGDVVLIAPVHSCLAAEQFSTLTTLDGVNIPRVSRVQSS